MIKSKYPIILASKSPRRKKLLRQIGLEFKTMTADVNEEFIDGENPVDTVKRLAVEKLKAAEVIEKSGIIISADTIVVLNGIIIGKPRDENDAERILSALSGNTHQVYTGFAIKNIEKNSLVVDYEQTDVTFRSLAPEEISEYISSGSPMDKAGAYGIQDDYGAVFVSKIEGCYYNVVGLPLAKLYSQLKRIA